MLVTGRLPADAWLLLLMMLLLLLLLLLLKLKLKLKLPLHVCAIPVRSGVPRG